MRRRPQGMLGWTGPGSSAAKRRRHGTPAATATARSSARKDVPQPGFCPSHCGGSCGRGLPRAATYGRHPYRNHQALPGQPASRSRLSVAGREFESRLLIQTLSSRTIDPRSRPVVRTWVTNDVLGEMEWTPPTCASHLSHPGCIKNADRSAGTGDGTIFAVRRA